MQNNVIDFHAHRAQQKQEQLAVSFHDMFTMLFDFYLQYFVYPLIAAVATASQKRIVKISH